jgi:hypothetical protein
MLVYYDRLGLLFISLAFNIWGVWKAQKLHDVSLHMGFICSLFYSLFQPLCYKYSMCSFLFHIFCCYFNSLCYTYNGGDVGFCVLFGWENWKERCHVHNTYCICQHGTLTQSFDTTNWSQNGLQAPRPNGGQSPQMFLCAFEILCLSDGIITFLRDIIFSNSRARWFRIHLPLFQSAEFTKQNLPNIWAYTSWPGDCCVGRPQKMSIAMAMERPAKVFLVYSDSMFCTKIWLGGNCMPMFCCSEIVSEVKVLVEGITRSGSSYGTFLLDLGP